MTLQKYLKQKKLTTSEFAKQAKVSQPTVWRVANKKVKPTMPVALKIVKACKGGVKLKELY